MKMWSIGAGILACTVSGVAYAETWKAAMVFQSGTSACQSSQANDYTFTLEGLSFTVANVNGKMLTMTIPESGEVNQNFKSSSGARLQVLGNAKTKELSIRNTDLGCVWKAVARK